MQFDLSDTHHRHDVDDLFDVLLGFRAARGAALREPSVILQATDHEHSRHDAKEHEMLQSITTYAFHNYISDFLEHNVDAYTSRILPSIDTTQQRTHEDLHEDDVDAGGALALMPHDDRRLQQLQNLLFTRTLQTLLYLHNGNDDKAGEHHLLETSIVVA